MNTIKIKELYIRNFKCYEQLTISFNPENTKIQGITGLGKTTIKDAYLWVLGFDCDFAPKIDDRRIKNLETKVIVVLNKNGTDHKFTRINKPKWKVNEETGNEEFAGNDFAFFYDNEQLSATSYKNQVAEFFDILNVRLVADMKGFNTDNGTKWTWKERREFLFDLLGISTKSLELLDNPDFSLIKKDILTGSDETQIALALNAEKKCIADKLKTNKTLIADKTSELQWYPRLDFEFFEHEKARLEQDLEDLQREHIQQDVDNKNKIATIEREITSLQLQIDSELANADSLEKASNNIFTTEILDNCPTCGHEFSKEKKLKLKAQIELDKFTKMTELKDKAEDCRSNARNLESRLNTRIDELLALQAARNASDGILESKGQYAKQYNDLKGQIDDINSKLYTKVIIENLESRIGQLKRETRTLLNQESARLRKQNTLKKYIEAKIALTNEEVSKHFNGITFKFFKFNTANAENEYQPTCECMLNGVVYSNLSQGQKIIADFETNKGLQKILELNVPQFIDNKQDNTFKMESDCQVVELITCEDTNINATFIRDIYSIDDCEQKGGN